MRYHSKIKSAIANAPKPRLTPRGFRGSKYWCIAPTVIAIAMNTNISALLRVRLGIRIVGQKVALLKLFPRTALGRKRQFVNDLWVATMIERLRVGLRDFQK